MKVKRKYLVRVWLAVCVFLIGMTALQGCESSQADSQVFTQTKLETQLAQTAEQTACPIMGMAIDKNVYTEYEGKKVYFCCPGCIDKFKASPSSYIAKLPQFKN